MRIEQRYEHTSKSMAGPSPIRRDCASASIGAFSIRKARVQLDTLSGKHRGGSAVVAEKSLSAMRGVS
jgi:hypothetical protein